MRRLSWTEHARLDLLEIGDWIALDSPAAARRFVHSILDKVAVLQHMPHCGRVVPEFGRFDIREIIFGNYRIVYRAGEGTIEILTVFEGHRLLDKDLSSLDTTLPDSPAAE